MLQEAVDGVVLTEASGKGVASWLVVDEHDDVAVQLFVHGQDRQQLCDYFKHVDVGSAAGELAHEPIWNMSMREEGRALDGDHKAAAVAKRLGGARPQLGMSGSEGFHSLSNRLKNASA